MKKVLIVCLLIPFIGFTQIQIGEDIDGELTIGGDNSGRSISLSSDGSVVAIEAPENEVNGTLSGHVRIYRNISGVWTQIGSDIDGEADGHQLGASISLSSDGNIVAIGVLGKTENETSSGYVRVYRNISDVWTQIGTNIDDEATASVSRISVSLSSDGSIVAVSETGNDENGAFSGNLRIYRNISDVWTQVGTNIKGVEEFDISGSSVSLSIDGNVVAIGVPSNDDNGDNSGHVRIYRNLSDVWTQVGTNIEGETAGDKLGASISLSSDGNTVAIGAYLNDGNGNDSGHVRIYENISNVWTQVGTDIDGEATGDESGFSVSLSSDGSVIAIGAHLNDGNGNDSGHVRIYRNISNVWTQIGSDIDGEAAGDQSGYSVSLSSDGSIVAIGAINNDGIGFNSGHVRIYQNISDIWIQIGEDIDDGEPSGGFFGSSVSLSSDGSVLAVGATGDNGNGESSGHVRIYRNISGVWTQIGEDIDGEYGGNGSGTSVSLSFDGSVVAIGAPGNYDNGSLSGHVRIYRNISDVWTQVGSDIDGEEAGDWSGYNISLSSNGSIVAIGARGNDGSGFGSGHVRIYRNISDVWTQVGSDIDGEEAGDRSGSSVSLSSDGSIVAIGAIFNDGNGRDSGHVRIYKNVSNVWTQVGSDIDGEEVGDRSGYRVNLSFDGSIVAIGAIGNYDNDRDFGYVRIYKNISDVWTQEGNDINGESAVDTSGYSMSLSSDGSVLAIGSIGSVGSSVNPGHVRIYKNISDVWTQVGTDIYGEAVGDSSGYSISLSSNGSIVAIGAPRNNGNGFNSGHVRVYDLTAVLSTESFNQDYFSMYPNPAQNKVELQLKNNQELKQVNIYTILGEYIYSLKTLKLDISHLSSGIYVLEVETNQGRSAKKLIKE